MDAVAPYLPLLVVAGLYALLAAVMRSPTPVVVAHGVSMEPSISRGSLLLLSNHPEVFEVNDIIVFTAPLQHTQIVHRVVAVREDRNGNIFYTTMGDNNGLQDHILTARGKVYGKVIAVLPLLGLPVLFVHRHQRAFLMVVIMSISILLFSFQSSAPQGQPH
jgi:signal peptidase I